MRQEAIVLAAALLMGPPGAKAADLVVSWEKGFYPQEDEAVAEIIAAFEQETGKHVQLVQPTQYEVNDKVRAALAAGQPPDFLYGTITAWGRWAYEDQLADLEDVLRPVPDCYKSIKFESIWWRDDGTGHSGQGPDRPGAETAGFGSVRAGVQRTQHWLRRPAGARR